MSTSRTTGFSFATLAICVWGVTFVSTKFLLAEFSALEILVFRFLLAWAALWVIHPRGMGVLRFRDEALFAAAGLAGATSYQMLENLAIHFTNASNVSVLVATAPLFAAVCSRLMLGERVLSRRFLAGCAMALAGVALVALGGIRGLRFRPSGDALALGSALSWGVYSALVTVVNRGGWHPVAAIRRAFFWALVFMAPLVAFALLAPDTVARVSCTFDLSLATNAARFAKLANLGNLAFLGLLASALCFILWNAACERLGTVRCSLGLYLIPVVALLAAHLFLGETLPAAAIAGALLVVSGVAIAGSGRTSFGRAADESGGPAPSAT